ncbi:SGNH hydrolase-type esterase domain-containing protein [Stachybotrys elegans]|uniref:SGNH hydrolase-type esterase domain-containing protein n=1 Tax=Stachybotrys elegans TaxID=80388 RepID=A0A8K0WNR9_9HYPO|nr:SGNH hydrolase-type esterase domain-containing protein [Stachybotrys elegans]
MKLHSSTTLLSLAWQYSIATAFRIDLSDLRRYGDSQQQQQPILRPHRPDAIDAVNTDVDSEPSSSQTPSTLDPIPFPRQPFQRPAGFIALGDSYSAGIGTGVNGTEDDCRHGIHGYPMLIHNDLVASEGPDATTFQFLSCTGSTINDMLAGSEVSQIDQFNTTDTTDFALLSIGGNDLGFFEIMNSCIFRFYSFYSGTCESALQKSEAAIASPEFEHRLRIAIMEILDMVHWEKRPWFTITVTGYARFFNEHTDECDDCSFGVWWRGPKLKKDLRKRMNEMVLSVNDKIKRSIDSINNDFLEPKVFFVDYDEEFEGHRFCEPGVIEPDYARNDTWFFLVGGEDNWPAAAPNISTRTASSDRNLLGPSSPLVDPDICLEPALQSGDWGVMALCMMARAAKNDPTLRARHGEVVAENSMWYVPTYYGKTFHPRSLGHKAAKKKVYELWEQLRDERGF